MRLLVLILALAFAMNDDGAKQGRKGNELYRNADHETATQLFTSGITEQNSSEPGVVNSGLWNNLGASLHRLGKFDEARQAFSNAVALAPGNNDVARSSYNAGNNAFEAFQQSSQQPMAGGPGMPQGIPQSGAPQAQSPQGQQEKGEGLEDALAHYKQSMLADPTNEDAKFNYEYVKRKLDEQQQNQDQQQQEDQNNQDQQNNENQENQEQQDQQQDQQQQDQDQQNQQQQDQQQQQEQEQQEQQQQEQEQQPPPDPNKLSKEEAERILQALQNEEEELLREVMKSQARPKKVEKDW